MPGFYTEGEYDVAGFAVGAVKQGSVIDGKSIREGDVLLGLPSSGVHSNGFSLVRKILEASFCYYIGLHLLQHCRPPQVHLGMVQSSTGQTTLPSKLAKGV